jgi:hypothetical protein
MILSVQFVNDVRRGEGIMFCPYCSRILFHEMDEVEGEVEEEEESGDQEEDSDADFDSDSDSDDED